MYLATEKLLWVLHQIAKDNGRFECPPPRQAPSDEFSSWLRYHIAERENRFPNYPDISEPLKTTRMTPEEARHYRELYLH